MRNYLGKLFVSLLLSIVGAICINTPLYFEFIESIKEQVLYNNYLIDASGFVLSTVSIIIATDVLWLLICWCEDLSAKKQLPSGFRKSEVTETISNELNKR